MSWSSAKDILTLSLGAIGTGLGVYNSILSFNQRRMRLVPVAKYAIPYFANGGVGAHMACIEVTNLSDFPVYLSEIGFELIGTKSRLAITQPLTSDHLPFTRKLDSRQSLTGYFDVPHNGPYVARRCYVRAESGEIFYGNALAT